MIKYRMFIDEVGNADLLSSDDPNHRFLSLTGVVVDLAYIESAAHPQMEAIKSAYFGSHPDEPVVLHRKQRRRSCGPSGTSASATCRTPRHH